MYELNIKVFAHYIARTDEDRPQIISGLRIAGSDNDKKIRSLALGIMFMSYSHCESSPGSRHSSRKRVKQSKKT